VNRITPFVITTLPTTAQLLKSDEASITWLLRPTIGTNFISTCPSPIQTPGAPLLTITHTTTNTVIVSWPSTATGFNLQTNATLATPSWGASTVTPSDDGSNKFIIVNPPPGNRFFRLVK
jgi:hypothetical protein